MALAVVCDNDSVRWRVKIHSKTGNDLPAVLENLGYNLEGDMLSGEQFEILDNSVTVFHAARRLARTIEEVGALTAFLVSDAGRLISGGVHFVDAGYNIMA